jgi:RNA polymerase sigma-70 factor (ECF subfamily)
MDEYAIVLAARDDPRAFAPLYEAYADLVWRYAVQRLRDRDRAAEATSATFARALAALPGFQLERRGDGTSFRAWLMTIARRVVIDLAKDAQRTTPIDNPVLVAQLVDARPSPESIAVTNEEQCRVTAALERLRPTERRVVELRLLGFQSKEIGEIVGMTAGAVNTAHFRAFRRLRELLSDECNDVDAEGRVIHVS